MARRSQRQLQLPVPDTWGGRRAGAGPPAGAWPAEDGTRPTRSARTPPSRPADPTSRVERSLSALDRALRGRSRFDRPQRRRDVSRSAFLGATRSRARDRRGRQPRRPDERRSRTRHPRRLGRQARRRHRPSMGRSLPRTRADDAARGPQRDRLRPSQLPEAPAGARRHRPAQLRPLVRRLGTTLTLTDRVLSDSGGTNLARRRRLAPRRSHSIRRRSEIARETLRINYRGFKMDAARSATLCLVWHLGNRICPGTWVTLAVSCRSTPASSAAARGPGT